MLMHGDPVDPRPSLPCTHIVPAAGCPPAPLRDTTDCSLADVAPAMYSELADPSLADFALASLRNSAGPSPARRFNRQCLRKSAHRPSDLIASARLLSAHGG